MSEDELHPPVLQDNGLDLKEAYLLGRSTAILQLSGTHELPIYDAPRHASAVDSYREIAAVMRANKFIADMVYEIKREIEEVEDVTPSPDEVDEEDQPVTLSGAAGQVMETKAKSWHQIIKAELQKENQVHLIDSRTINVDSISESPSELFEDGEVWDSLPKRTKNDIVEACTAVSVGLTTSAVFMSLRAVEERLQKWYESETSNDLGNKTFGQVLSELDSHYGDRPPILSHLDYLKERRNQVAHPDRFPDQQEAESTLIMVRETIRNIQQQIS